MMPIVNVKLLEGRSDEQLKNLVSEVTDVVEKQRGQIDKQFTLL